VLALDRAIGDLQAIGKGVGECGHFQRAAAGVQGLNRRARAATAAADQADLDQVAAVDIRAAGDLDRAGGNRAAGHQQRGIPQKGAPRSRRSGIGLG
jgi:hypothetical protein